jgi:hypothetical protein
VAGLLIESLEEVDEAEVESAWRTEVARRIRDIDEGVSSSISWQDLRRKLENRSA